MTDAGTLLKQAEKAHGEGQWDTAVDSYQKFLDMSPDSAMACRKLADVLAIRGRLHATLVTLQHLVAVLDSLNDLDGVVEVIDQLLLLKPDSDDIWNQKIDLYFRQGNTEAAVALSREVGQRALSRGDEELAVKILRRACEADPANLEMTLQLAEAVLNYGQIQEAQRLYRKVGSNYLENNDLEKAAETFRRLTVFAPPDTGLFMILGDLNANLGRYPEAEASYRGILKQDINHVEALLGLARISQFKGQHRDCILALNRVLSVAPDDVRALEKLGEVNRLQGLTQDSVKYYLMAGLASLEENQPRKSQQFFQLVLEQDPRNTVAIRSLHELEGKV